LKSEAEICVHGFSRSHAYSMYCTTTHVYCTYALKKKPSVRALALTGQGHARGCSWPEQKVAVSPCNLVTDSYVEKLLSLLDGICTTHVIPFGPILFICIALYLSISCRFRFCMMSNDSKSRHCIVALLAFERRERLFFSSPTLNR
jgi:hypothetical protein